MRNNKAKISSIAVYLSIETLSILSVTSLATAQTLRDCPQTSGKIYDVIVFGDEVPGVMTAIKLKSELSKYLKNPQVALITEGDINKGIGGHLVRGGLGYLDRNQIPPDMLRKLPRFSPASHLYQQFLEITQTKTVALDRFKANEGFKTTLAKEKIEVIGNIQLKSVKSIANDVCSFTTRDNKTFAAKEFIDASQSGKFSQMAGVKFLPGFAALGLPDSSLSVGLVFETYGLTIKQLKQIEAKLITRLENIKDRQAQSWLSAASGQDLQERQAILSTLIESDDGNLRTFSRTTEESADVRSLAFTTAFHGGINLKILNPKALLDRANIAILDDRLSFNAILFYVNSEQARYLSENGSHPQSDMQDFAEKVKRFFLDLGANRVEIMDELYIRSTDQIAHPVEELSSTLMTEGGIPSNQALGTFSYHLDVRGGIAGLGIRASNLGIKNIDFHYMPTFNYGFRHTLPQERENLAVLGPTSGFGGLGEAAGRIVEFNVSVGEGLAIAVSKAIIQQRSLSQISNLEVRQALGYTPTIYGRATKSFHTVFLLEKTLRRSVLLSRYEKHLVAGIRDIATARQTDLDQAIDLAEHAKYYQALEQYNKAIAHDPNDALAYYDRGVALTHLYKYKTAIEDYTKAISSQVNFVAAYKNRGLLYSRFYNHLPQAIADYDQVIKLAPKDPAGYLGKGYALALQGKKRAAILLLLHANWLNPKLAIVNTILGEIYNDLGQRAAAIFNYQRASVLYREQNNQSSYHNTLLKLEELTGQSSYN